MNSNMKTFNLRATIPTPQSREKWPSNYSLDKISIFDYSGYTVMDFVSVNKTALFISEKEWTAYRKKYWKDDQ